MTPAVLAEQVLQGRAYAEQRARWRREMIALKRVRRVHLGPDIELLFESRATVLFQLQEVLFIESISRPERVAEAVAEHAARMPAPGRLMTSLMLCVGSGADALRLGAALAEGGLRLNLSTHSAYAQLNDEGDIGSPLRYLSFDDWQPRTDDGLRALTLTHDGKTLTTTLSGTLGRALEREAIAPTVAPALPRILLPSLIARPGCRP